MLFVLCEFLRFANHSLKFGWSIKNVTKTNELVFILKIEKW